MSQFPTLPALDADRYLDGPFSLDEGEDVFAHAEWADTDSDPDLPREHGQTLSALGLVYLRHGDPARAMVLGLAAMTMGDLAPATILLVAEAMLSAGDPEQAMTVLSRFDRPGATSRPPDRPERAARHYLTARVLHRRGDSDAARAELIRARELSPAGPAPAQGGRAE